MKAIEVIQHALEMGDRTMMMLIEDMRDAPLTQPTPCGGNHPTWALGHITFVEANVQHMLFGEPNPLKHWAPLFAPGTEPTTDATKYPPFDEIIRTYRDFRARNLKALEETGEAGLDRPSKAPPKGLEDALGTFGKAFLGIAMHQMSHRGQLADARRAAGRKPIFTPSLD